MRFPTVWPWPDTPELPLHDENATKTWMKNLLVVLQLLTSAIAVKVNNELVSSVAGQVAKMYGTLDLSSSQGLILPKIAGDWASPVAGEIWYNLTLHRFRGALESPAYTGSFVFYRTVAMNQALGSSVGAVAFTLSPPEPDTNYHVLVETTWGTTWSLGATKATNGFTVTFGTATPDGNQKVTCGLLRGG